MPTVTRVKGNKKHPLRNGIVTSAVLLVLLIGGGIVYTYFSNTGNSAVKPAAATTLDPVIKPVKPAETAPASASMQVLSPRVAAGENAAVNVQTVAGSNCTITVLYNNQPARDSGLVAKTADQYGIVAWTWTVATGTPEGDWPVTVTCIYTGRSAVVTNKLTVGKAVPAP